MLTALAAGVPQLIVLERPVNDQQLARRAADLRAEIAVMPLPGAVVDRLLPAARRAQTRS